jgi:hypothetical protein
VFNKPTLEKSTVAKPPKPMVKDHGGGQDPRRVLAPVKRRKKKR